MLQGDVFVFLFDRDTVIAVSGLIVPDLTVNTHMHRHSDNPKLLWKLLTANNCTTQSSNWIVRSNLL